MPSFPTSNPHILILSHIGTPFEKKLLKLLQVRKGENERKKRKLSFV
jgi:hypothetical protein